MSTGTKWQGWHISLGKKKEDWTDFKLIDSVTWKLCGWHERQWDWPLKKKNVHYSISGSDSAAHTSVLFFLIIIIITPHHLSKSRLQTIYRNKRHRPQKKKIVLKYYHLLPQTVRLLENGKSFENAVMQTTYWCTWCRQPIWCMKFSFRSS